MKNTNSKSYLFNVLFWSKQSTQFVITDDNTFLFKAIPHCSKQNATTNWIKGKAKIR